MKTTNKSFVQYRSAEMKKINPKGTKQTKTHKKRISESLRQSLAERKNHVIVIYKPKVVQEEKRLVFVTIADAARFIGCSKQLLSQCLRPNTNNRKAYGWEVKLEEID